MKKNYKKKKVISGILQEPIVEYGTQKELDISQLTTMGMDDVLKKGMLLEDSRRIILKKIAEDFK